ncbi:hypothetical protein GF376_00175 [Candidatus Peregrinibacteria bacterium]|nr:hypothetical protein [Candidatus Peregrinibacteria bacterium]
MKQIEHQIIDLINRSENILVMPSSPPDGDSLGSAMALYLSLRKLNKKVTVVCADPVPEVYKFLPMMNTIKNELAVSPDFIITLDTENAKLDSIHSKVEHNKVNIILTAKKGQFSQQNVSFSHGPSKYDLIITVDTAATKQLGKFYEDNVKMFTEIPVINIDHHPSNENFGRINYVDVMNSATTEMILGILENLEEITSKELVDEEVATLLLAGIITDTGSFQHSNTTPKSFSNSAKLIKRGARQQEIIQHVYKTKHLTTLKLWGRILSKIKIDQKHKFLWSVITQKDIKETGSNVDETGDIIDELMTNAPEVEIVLLLKERSDNILSGSVRTTSDAVDATQIAAMFGGGGHAKAAGFKIPNATFESQGMEIIEKIQKYQTERLNLETTIENYQAPDTEAIAPEPDYNPKIEQKNTSKTKTITIKSEEPQQMEDGVVYRFEN